MTEIPPGNTRLAVGESGLKVSWGLGAVGCFAALICAAGVIIAPILKSAGASTESSQCASNLRRISAAMFEYAEANGGLLPGEKWNDALASLEPDPVVFACPHQRRTDPKSSGYALNKVLAGKPLAKVEAPATTVLVFDSRPTVPGVVTEVSDTPKPGRHRNGRSNNVAYADGRVGSVEP